MTAPRRALLLVGSPKGPRSTSQSLGSYLLERLQNEAFEAETLRINPSPASDARRQEYLRTVYMADLVVLAFPLYVDALPFPVVKVMEFLAEHRKETTPPKKTLLMAISNCGFPEAEHNETALAICRRFAGEAGFVWAGGLALGGGGAIGGKPLESLGGMVRKIRKSLDLAAAALAQGKAVPQEAVNLMARPLVPSWLYVLIAELGWRSEARKNGVRGQLQARPYLLELPEGDVPNNVDL